MTTSQPEDLWTDILATLDELPDEQAWYDGSGGRRYGKINVAALAAALAIPAGAAAIATIGLMNAQPAYASSSGGGTTGSSGGGTTASSGGGTTAASSGGATTAASSGGGTTAASSGGGTTASSGGGTTASSGGGTTTASSGGSTTASSGGTTTASSGGGATASGNGATASGNGATASAPGSTASGNGTTRSGNGTTVGAARGMVAAAWDGTGQQDGQPAQQPVGQDSAPPAGPAQQPSGQGDDPPAAPAQQPIGQDGAAPAAPAQQPSGQGGDPPAQQPSGQDGAPLAGPAQQPSGQDGAAPAGPAQQPSGQDGAAPAGPAQQPSGQDGAPTSPNPTGDTLIDGIQSWPLQGAASPPAQQGQPPATAAPTGPAASPAPSQTGSWGVHGFLFAGPAAELTVGLPIPGSPHVGGWAFGGGYVEAGFSNIGTPNATFDGSHGYIAGGGGVVGVNAGPVGDVDVEGGILWEKGVTDWSWPLGSGTTGQNTNQWSEWSPNYYGGVVVGDHEIGGLGACDSQNCNLTLFYGRAAEWPLKGGPFTLKPQIWGGGGLTVTWPARLWKPF